MSVSPGNRSVLVTGAADGIGRGIATIFARAGDRVALLDYDADKPAQTTEALQAGGAEALAIQADVRDAADVRAAVDEAVGRHGRLDVAVSNAGIYPTGPSSFFLCSAEAQFITGAVLSVDGGSSAGRFHLPRSD